MDSIGQAGDALDYALDHIDDPWNRVDFLESWREGDLAEWPEYADWLAVQHQGAREAKAAAGTMEPGTLVERLRNIDQRGNPFASRSVQVIAREAAAYIEATDKALREAREAIEELRSRRQHMVDFYERNGSPWTIQGSEFFDAERVIVGAQEDADFAAQALAHLDTLLGEGGK